MKKGEAIERSLLRGQDMSPPIEVQNRRNQIAADFELVFIRNPRGIAVLAEIARILHFAEAAETPQDMALQNAFKSILHRLDRWTDDDDGVEDLVTRLLGR